jgi:hypothetical protein
MSDAVPATRQVRDLARERRRIMHLAPEDWLSRFDVLPPPKHGRVIKDPLDWSAMPLLGIEESTRD